MALRKLTRWQDMDHSGEPLYEQIVGPRSNRVAGPMAEFLAKKQAERAPATFLWYRYSLLQLHGFLEAQGSALVADFNEHTVNLFQVHLRNKGSAENTISNRLRAIKVFARWMAKRRWTEVNVLEDLRAPQSTKPQFDLIPDDLRQQLFSLFPSDTYLGSRNVAMLGVLSDTGLRREEVVGIQLKNLDLDGHVLKVYSEKTDEWRYLPLTDEVTALLRNHLHWRQRFFDQPSRRRAQPGDANHRDRSPRIVRADRLFLAANGMNLQPQALGLIMYRASQKLGARVHAHLFRHDWITRKALDGESPSLVRRWAGHRSFVMTDYYFGLAEDMLGAIKPKHSVLNTLTIPGVKMMRRTRKTALSGNTTGEH